MNCIIFFWAIPYLRFSEHKFLLVQWTVLWTRAQCKISPQLSCVRQVLNIMINSFLAQTNFICPEKDGLFEDTQQCDKYYDCFDGIPEERLCPDGLVFDPFSRKREPCDHYFNVDCGDRLELRKFDNDLSEFLYNSSLSLQSSLRAPVTCVPASTVSTPTPTLPSATSSTPVWMVRRRSTPAPQDSGSMSTAASVTGQRPQTGRSARLRPMVSSSWLRLAKIIHDI